MNDRVELCPICNQPCIDYYKDVLDGHTLMEEGWRCPSGHYSYDYNTGAYREVIGGREYVWNYSTKEGRQKRLFKVIRKRIEQLKKEYLSKPLDFEIGEWNA